MVVGRSGKGLDGGVQVDEELEQNGMDAGWQRVLLVVCWLSRKSIWLRRLCLGSRAPMLAKI